MKGHDSRARHTEPRISSTFSISGAGGGTGTIGEAEMRLRIYVEWLEGCGSYKYDEDCVGYDRFDNRFSRFAGDCTKDGGVD